MHCWAMQLSSLVEKPSLIRIPFETCPSEPLLVAAAFRLSSMQPSRVWVYSSGEMSKKRLIGGGVSFSSY